MDLNKLFLYPGLSMAAVPGSLVSPPRVSLQVTPPAVHSVLLVSNLNPEVRGHIQSQSFSSIRVLHLQVTVLTLSPQSVSPHCLFILFGEKHSSIFHQYFTKPYSDRSEFFHVHQASHGAPHGSMFGPLLLKFPVHLTLIFRKHSSMQMTTNYTVFIPEARRHQYGTKLQTWP